MRVAPLGWALVVVSSGFALVTVVVYLSTGAFTQGWLIASAIVYTLVAVAAVVLAALDRAPPAGEPGTAGPTGEAVLVSRVSVYSTAAGDAVRLTYRWPDDRVELRYVAMTTGQMTNDQEIVTYVDALPAADEPADLDEAVDEAIERRRLRARPQETETA